MVWFKWVCSSALVASVAPALADQPAAVNSGAGGTAGFEGIVLSGQASRLGEEGVTINISNTCFGTNLRHVSNPLAPDSRIKVQIVMQERGVRKNYTLSYPAKVTSSAGQSSVEDLSRDLTPGVRAQSSGNKVRVVLPISITTTLDEEGNIRDDFDAKLVALSFEQEFDPGAGAGAGRAYMGAEGKLSATVHTNPSKDGKQYDVAAFFPGQVGYCGGFFSPLMVFFDDKMPLFTSVVDFPLNPTGKTMWPEPGAPGAFIAIDRDGDGLITKVDELFGSEGEKYKNGFEALREFDSNRDEVIDGKDKDFAKLSLWFDKNGDGKVQKGELVPLRSRIQSVSLKYDASAVGAVADRAEVREKSTFVFVEKGKKKQGRVIDLWFSPEVK